MTDKKFNNLINDIQEFMGLDNWDIIYNISEIKGNDTDSGKCDAICDVINYSYFRTSITFSPSVLKEDDYYITHLIFHEFSHIYTMNTLEGFDKDREFYSHYLGESNFIHIKNNMVMINEQQTEFLARRFHKLFDLSKK